jgi:AdoMet-dependent rRNA methyltransferase SPB1
LEARTKQVEELTETVEVVDIINEEEQIQQEVRNYTGSITMWLLRLRFLKLERLNAEAASRAKRERRRANEVKRKTIQRMQLQMTAPLDIGLEQTDAVLGYGQEDIFDLEHTERASRRKGFPDSSDTDAEDKEPEENNEDVHSLDDEVLDTDEEQNSRVQTMEDELDGLYEAYRERLAERDAKFKTREARQGDKRREEWSGIERDEGRDDMDEGSEDGGWYEMEQRKARNDDSDSSSIDEEGDEALSPRSPKRKRADRQETPKKRARLLTSLEEPQTISQMSRRTDVWFSQDIFKGLDQVGDDDGVSQLSHDDEVRS